MLLALQYDMQYYVLLALHAYDMQYHVKLLHCHLALSDKQFHVIV